MVETKQWDNAEINYSFAAQFNTTKAFHRELTDVAREICQRIRKETKARSHKQVMHYSKKFEGEQRVDLVIALNQIYTTRARNRRRYIAADMVLDRIRETRAWLPILAKFFNSVAKDFHNFDTQLAALEGGLMLLGDDA